MRQLVYLAAPYSHSNPEVVAARMQAFLEVDAKLLEAGFVTVSPLSKHFTLPYANLGSDWNFWKDYSERLIKACEIMFVITLDGWKESTGVQAEIALATELGIEVRYISPY